MLGGLPKSSELSTAIDTSAAPVPVTLTPVGNPIWQLTDFHLFSAPAATDEQLDAVQNAVLPFHAQQPSVPHTNYATELEEGIAAAGFPTRTTFTAEDIAGNPLGLAVGFVSISAAFPRRG